MAIAWVLFDADGVIQGVRDGWLEQLTQTGGERGEEFVLAVFAAESACLRGRDFAAELEAVIAQFGLTGPVEEVIDPQYWIEVDAGMLAAVRYLRSNGVRCALATNQQNLRGRFMQESLGYAEAFDAQFYSFELGQAKPDRAYFAAVVQQAGVSGQEVLFLDDHWANVAAARQAGLNAELFPRHGGVAALAPILAAYGLSAAP